MTDAAAAVGVSPSTVRLWNARGRRELDRVETLLNRGGGRPRIQRAEALYARFSAAVARARAQVDCLDVARIRASGDRDWRALAFRLRARSPEKWSERTELAVGGPAQGPEDGETRAALAPLLVDPEVRDAMRLVARKLLAAEAEEGQVVDARLLPAPAHHGGNGRHNGNGKAMVLPDPED
jgi:hypothetical protein